MSSSLAKCLARFDIEQLQNDIEGREVVVSVSGGKDSTACCLLMKHLGIPFRAVHMDTGWEDSDTDRYVRDVLPHHIGPIEVIQADAALTDPAKIAKAEEFERRLGKEYSAMVRFCIQRGMFPSRKKRFCTQELKIFPFRDYCYTLDGDVLSVVGIRADESPSRAKMGEWDWNLTFECEVWRPLIEWTEADVIDIHKMMNCPPNPLYVKGAARVGCWPCIYARKHEIRMLSELSPERASVLADLERYVTELAHQRYTARGETFESLGYGKPCFFQNPRYRADKRKGRQDAGRPLPIAEVIEWARTKRGKDEVEPFAPLPHEQGCMRWGFCDTSWRKE